MAAFPEAANASGWGLTMPRHPPTLPWLKLERGASPGTDRTDGMEGAGMTRREAILAELEDRSLTEIARRHGVTRGRVGQIRRAAGIPRQSAPPGPEQHPARRAWTDEDVAYLIAHADRPVAEVAAALGRSIGAVYENRHRLAKKGRVPKRRVSLTADELALLADPSMTDAEVARRTGQSPEVIYTSRRVRGLRAVRR
jgi:hypothetical protein